MAMSRTVVRALVVFALLASAATMLVADQAPEYQVKAEFIERFTRFIDWPAGSDGKGTFVIGVVGENPFNGFLERMAAQYRIKNRPVEIRTINELSQIDSCQLVFIASTERDRLRRILAHTESKPILTVADSTGFAQQGVIINFYNAGDKVHFEINEAAGERSGLRVSSKLLKLARLVESGSMR